MEVLLSRNQLNQKLKLMVEVSGYVICSNTPPHSRAIWAKSMDAAQALLISSTKYSTLNEGWLTFKPVTSCHVGF